MCNNHGTYVVCDLGRWHIKLKLMGFDRFLSLDLQLRIHVLLLRICQALSLQLVNFLFEFGLDPLGFLGLPTLEARCIDLPSFAAGEHLLLNFIIYLPSSESDSGLCILLPIFIQEF